MRASAIFRYANPASLGRNNPLKPAPLALLPPIPLYRRLFRAHRKLAPDERMLGDMYIKSEFRAHRSVENPIHIVRIRFSLAEVVGDQVLTCSLQVGFLTEWQLYAQMLEQDGWKEAKIDKEKLEKMSGMCVGGRIVELY